jgi:glutamate transport system substrate-binding protein
MRFQKITGFGVAGFLAAALAACGSGGSAASGTGESAAPALVSFPAGTTMDRLAKAHKITIGTFFDQPLFGLQSLSGEPEGFDIEMGKIIASELGIPETGIFWVATPAKDRASVLEQKRVDVVVATYTINDERRQHVTFAGPYFVAGQDLMVKENNKTITGPDSLKAVKAKVCSEPGTTPAENILNYIPRSQLVLFGDISKCGEALRVGEVDAVTTDNAILLGMASDNRGAFKVLAKPFTKEPWGVAVPKGDIPFCNFINQVLTKAAADGRYEAAWTRTAGAATTATIKLPALDPCV